MNCEDINHFRKLAKGVFNVVISFWRKPVPRDVQNVTGAISIS